MRRRLGFFTAVAVAASGAAGAQQGTLSGVTMRVLDDLSHVDVVVLVLEPREGERREDNPRGAEEVGERARSTEAADAEEGGDARRERDELHDAESSERSEGRQEDGDIESTAERPPA